MPSGRQGIPEVAARRLVEKFCGSEPPDRSSAPAVTTERGEVVLSLGSDAHVLTRAEAARLRESLADALAAEHEFVHTAAEHRADGAYVVRRRGADSAGHRKVFDSHEALRALYERLPREFTAGDVEAEGLSGGRRHMVLRHLVEHPGFDCRLVSRQPLTARKEVVGPAAGDD